MKLTFIGSGSAFTVGDNNYQSNMLLENNAKKRLLIDCGSDARLACYELGIGYKDIDAVYISHLHADHTGGLEWLALMTHFDASCQKPQLFTSDTLVGDLWDHVLSGGLSLSSGLSSYFTVRQIGQELLFTWEEQKFQVIPVRHAGQYSYGVMFEDAGRWVYITTDTEFVPDEMMATYKKADSIFHDCETQNKKTGVHAHYEELKTLPREIKEKMWLYHINPGPKPDVKKDGFRGLVQKGQVFDLSIMEKL